MGPHEADDHARPGGERARRGGLPQEEVLRLVRQTERQLGFRVVVGRKAEREHGGPGFVRDIHYPRAVVPDRMAIVPDHFASGQNGLLASFGNPGKLGTLGGLCRRRR